jgi:hypothetical protein
MMVITIMTMRNWQVLILAAASGLSAHAAVTLTGVIGDDMCAGDHKTMGGTDAMKCTADCIKTMGAKYALVVGKEAYILSDQAAAAKFSGKKVTVTGDEGTTKQGAVTVKTLTVKSIAPAN